MRKIRFIKGNLRRGDHLRSIITDTSPYEVPMIVSNDGFYKNLNKISSFSNNNKDIINKIILRDSKEFTIPYRYTVTKDNTSVRRLSLLHPSAQINIAKFYSKYDSLICYFASNSQISIRHPKKVGSTFFFSASISEQNKYKNNRIDTTEIEKFVRNPASYFSYSGYDRMYKFYSSNSFIRLEKKFSIMTLLDISKCFDSIYTHSISWAVKTAPHSKENTSAISFGNDFDNLMQKSNYNETNGISIGPETSRIFAEIILQRCDKEILREAHTEGLIFGKDFECKRYVDDYILFCKNIEIEQKIISVIKHCLSQFNLHLNDQKMDRFNRPFLTPKSHVISTMKIRLSALFDSIFERVGPNLLAPQPIYRPSAFIRGFITSIKSGCYEHKVGYDMVANYIISSLSKRIDRLINDFTATIELEPARNEFYTSNLMALLELIFFFYTVNPTVASSFNVSRSLIIAIRFFRNHHEHDAKMAASRLQDWVNQFIVASSTFKRSSARSKIPVEILNLLIASCELHSSSQVSEEWLLNHVFNIDHMEYFSLVSLLFYIKDHREFSSIRLALESRIVTILGDCAEVARSSHDAHLALDVLCCPYVSEKCRRSILRTLRKQFSLPTLSRVAADSDLAEFLNAPWFVQWRDLDIVSMIRKKELSAVY